MPREFEYYTEVSYKRTVGRNQKPFTPEEWYGWLEVDESAFQKHVVNYATKLGWNINKNTVADQPGFPDLMLVKEPQIIYAELKTERGKVSIEQWKWLWRLTDSGQEAYVWRPSDLRFILERLRIEPDEDEDKESPT